MHANLDADRRWFKRYDHRHGTADVRLLCFHHAGGSAAMYREWPHLLPGSVEPIAVQLPGRADRFREPAYDRMAPLVDDLIEAASPLLDQPFACYGASMGARVAWAFTHALRERAMPMPRALFVASDAAPSSDNGDWPWEGRDDGLEGYVREMGGTPAEILAQPELLKMLLSTLHADLSVLSTHDFRPGRPLDVRIRAFAGARDSGTPPGQVSGWEAETRARFDLDLVPAGHFFDPDAERLVAAAIGRDLRAYL
jgi:medium-chain acyl-[acyl-carrier-protein] hydrolase